MSRADLFVALGLLVSGCAGPVPTDADAPAMTSEQYADFRQQEPLVAMALSGSPDVGPAIYRQAEINVASGRAANVNVEATRITDAVSVKVASIARQRNIVECSSVAGNVYWIGPLGAAMAIPMLLAQDVERRECIRSIQQ
ncbi:hypothetical protein [Pseudoroseomonas ludipueritiae]|uniref:Lipoprotein n=1 Tax=Pseudoroseomonas ludipueritiae TaxID=198093 RepID=A0ABR7R2N0_9PROT|nr:hypothetical protein [Pseudoroseomonas ludipueritiae]MBC9175932.1 hypothetical protein [Pseudoroseomonas ludipueritiae]